MHETERSKPISFEEFILLWREEAIAPKKNTLGITEYPARLKEDANNVTYGL